MMLNKKAHNRGFTLVQISALLMVASLVLVTVLPSTQKVLDANRATTARMNDLMRYFRIYMAANGRLPCPADASLATGAANYGITAAGSGSTTDCGGSTPAANYIDATNNVAVGMVPYKTLGIPRELVYDGWGRAITYAVDTSVTAGCWSTPATGSITVTDNGSAQQTVIALVSHGANGHGSWIPLAASSGTAVRLNNNSSNSNEQTNAHVDSSFAATSTLNNFVVTTPSSTFDDLIVYTSPFWTMNARPTVAVGAGGATITNVSTPLDRFYYYTDRIMYTWSGASISFTVTLDSAVTVSVAGGTPRLALTATSVGGGTVSLTGNGGSGGTGYANYVSGSGSTSLVFTYPLQSTDMAPNGFTMGTSIDLNGGSITTMCTNTFTAPTLTSVIIPKIQVLTTSGTYTVPVDWNSAINIIGGVGSGGNGAAGTATAGGAGGGGGAYGFSTALSATPGASISYTVGTGGGTTMTMFSSAAFLNVDYGRNAVGTTRGAGGSTTNTTVTGAGATENAGGRGGTNGGTTRGGGGGGGGSGGGGGTGMDGGNGANTGGGGGGGGGANGGSSTNGSNGAATGSNGGHGGRGRDGVAVSNRGAAGGGNAGNGVANSGTGGGGGGGSNSASVNSGSGGNGSISLLTGSSLNGWTVNVPSAANYGVSGGGGGSGGANGATSNSAAAGGGSSYGGGGGGSGGATGTPGAVGTGSPGLIIVQYR